MRRALAGVVLSMCSAAAVLASCSGSERTGASGNASGKDTTVSFFADAAPAPGTSPWLRSGQAIYGRYCAVCHGTEGEGDGFNAYNLQSNFGTTPTAFADSTVWETMDLEKARTAVTLGGKAVGGSPYMPPWGETLSSQEIEDVVAYIRSLAGPAPGS
jgi:mono/diheme cytochrome c family protein